MAAPILTPAAFEEEVPTELVVLLAPVCDRIAAEVIVVDDVRVVLVESVAVDEEVLESLV